MGFGLIIIGDEILSGRREDKHLRRTIELLGARGLVLDWAQYVGDDRERITAESERAGSALRIHDLFQQNAYLTANLLVERTGLSAPTVNAALADLECLGIVEEVTGRRRGRVFGYRRYLAILSEGTDPLPTGSS